MQYTTLGRTGFKVSKPPRYMDLAKAREESEPKGLVEPAMRFSLTCSDIAVTLTGTSSVESLTKNASYCDGIGLTQEEEARVLALFPGQSLF